MVNKEFTFTVDDLDEAEHHDIVCQGFCSDPIWDTGEQVKFVCVVGRIKDWAMYVEPCSKIKALDNIWGYNDVATMGIKIHDKGFIKRFLGVSDEVMKRYRD